MLPLLLILASLVTLVATDTPENTTR